MGRPFRARRGMAVPPALRKVLRFWEIPFLALLAWMMFRVRMLPYDKLVVEGRAYYIGTDPFYHFREILGGVRAWPSMPRYDIYTFYPFGTPTGQFGSLFDRVASTYIFLTGGRDATEEYVHEVVAAYPAVLGALLIVPFYFLAKRMLGTPGGIVAAITLSLLPGEFLIRSVAGYSDHHIAEALMATVAILGVYVAVERGHAHRAEISEWANVRKYWRVLAWGAVGGLALAAEFYTWPPAILFLAILTIWLTIVMLLENARGESARGHAVAGATAFVVAGVLLAPAIETTYLGEFNTYSLLHVLSLFAAAAWLLALDFAVERLAASRGRVRATTLVASVVGGVALMVFLAIFIVPLGVFAAAGIGPSIIGSFRWGLSWVTGIGVPRTTLTISEARPADFFCARDTGAASCLGNDFGIVAPIAFLLLLALIVFAIWKRRPSDILLALWSIVIFRATDTQIRFSYYLALNMALLIGWLGARLAEAAVLALAPTRTVVTKKGAGKGRRTVTRAVGESDNMPARLGAAALALLIVLPGNVLATDSSRPGWEVAERGFSGPDGDLYYWTIALEWMRQNTPDAGVDLGAIVEAPAPGQHVTQSPESYGVLSWWDYGHWMEVIARRAPVANPFQQAAPFASCFFTERDPERAEAMLRTWSARAYLRDPSQACGDYPVADIADVPLRDENPVRYLMIDDEMAAGKFGAITVWAQCTDCLAFNRSDAPRRATTQDDYNHALFKFWRSFQKQDGGRIELPWNGEPYRETMLSRLYFDDASGLPNYRLVYETPVGVRMGWVAEESDAGILVHNQNDILSGREQFDPAQWEFRSGEAAFRTADNRWLYDAAHVASVKTYERVKGAQLVGVAAPGASVEVSIDLVSDTTGRTFTWSSGTFADATGAFRIVVPYATTGYLSVAEGGTNLAVRAKAAAALTSGGRGIVVDVPDAAVLRGEEITATF